ncbi:MAG: hypothetical protein JWN82_448, partial [Candidatus Saccharibacteria bacterium]|nr:hypothetical protein [Candidatus Saccharibacteria bacterium]
QLATDGPYQLNALLTTVDEPTGLATTTKQVQILA